MARRGVELRHLGGINGLYQVAGGITKPFRRRIQQKTGARTKTLSWRIGQVLTTFVLLGALLILLAVSLMQEKGVSVLEAVKRQQLWFRWLIYLAAIFVVLLTGIYGPGFAASSFIYFQF